MNLQIVYLYLGGSLKDVGFGDGGEKPSPSRSTSLRGALRLRLPPFPNI
jgi:hypothetical protein